MSGFAYSVRCLGLALVASLFAFGGAWAWDAALGAPPLAAAVGRADAGHALTLDADLDGDHRLDQVCASSDGDRVSVRIFLSWTARPTSFHFDTRAKRIGVVACDVNHDGAYDLLFFNEGTLRPIALFVNRGNGTFDACPWTSGLRDRSIADKPFGGPSVAWLPPPRPPVAASSRRRDGAESLQVEARCCRGRPSPAPRNGLHASFYPAGPRPPPAA